MSNGVTCRSCAGRGIKKVVRNGKIGIDRCDSCDGEGRIGDIKYPYP